MAASALVSSLSLSPERLCLYLDPILCFLANSPFLASFSLLCYKRQLSCHRTIPSASPPLVCQSVASCVPLQFLCRSVVPSTRLLRLVLFFTGVLPEPGTLLDSP